LRNQRVLVDITLHVDALYLTGHYSKVACLQFHPLASNLLATGSADTKVIVWNIETEEQVPASNILVTFQSAASQNRL